MRRFSQQTFSYPSAEQQQFQQMWVCFWNFQPCNLTSSHTWVAPMTSTYYRIPLQPCLWKNLFSTKNSPFKVAKFKMHTKLAKWLTLSQLNADKLSGDSSRSSLSSLFSLRVSAVLIYCWLTSSSSSSSTVSALLLMSGDSCLFFSSLSSRHSFSMAVLTNFVIGEHHGDWKPGRRGQRWPLKASGDAELRVWCGWRGFVSYSLPQNSNHNTDIFNPMSECTLLNNLECVFL